MLLATSAGHPLANIGVADAGLVAILGYAVVFFGLILLMVVVMLLGKAFTVSAKKQATEATQAAPVVAAPAAEPEKAPGSAGTLKLHDVEPKTAAMLMAIVANQMGKPINELRFISIKEVK